jgi:hypothetical protein
VPARSGRSWAATVLSGASGPTVSIPPMLLACVAIHPEIFQLQNLLLTAVTRLMTGGAPAILPQFHIAGIHSRLYMRAGRDRNPKRQVLGITRRICTGRRRYSPHPYRSHSFHGFYPVPNQASTTEAATLP